ncbi:hypothetical protein BDK51DRAFT_27087 [Blyttiomyces helicus]|uniref:Uncharacterized protein n=1 Tax=Blyttiomyces helicus TaxID=388810 RepID=A0A4P9W0W2_9FUNG|nr:hypothetical protein BDK51DRAFT_27087 [Blyttiomyces helicus]|eukprot:RKO85789.1 hypothetical protein BDK51DRAFT_27087 [Blyttiomyces helicus]
MTTIIAKIRQFFGRRIVRKTITNVPFGHLIIICKMINFIQKNPEFDHAVRWTIPANIDPIFFCRDARVFFIQYALPFVLLFFGNISLLEDDDELSEHTWRSGLTRWNQDPVLKDAWKQQASNRFKKKIRNIVKDTWIDTTRDAGIQCTDSCDMEDIASRNNGDTSSDDLRRPVEGDASSANDKITSVARWLLQLNEWATEGMTPSGSPCGYRLPYTNDRPPAWNIYFLEREDNNEDIFLEHVCRSAIELRVSPVDVYAVIAVRGVPLDDRWFMTGVKDIPLWNDLITKLIGLGQEAVHGCTDGMKSARNRIRVVKREHQHFYKIYQKVIKRGKH